MEPTNLQMLVAEIKRNGKSTYSGAYHQVPFRIQLHLFPQIEALTQIMGSSRNHVLNELITVALDAVKESLDGDSLKNLETITAQLMKAQIEAVNIKSGGMEDA